jgi:phage baseplate assembly protein W
MMIGTSAETGKTINGLDHLRQSIARLLTTPVGSRVMRRNYGAYVFDLIDQPGNRAAILKVYAAVVDALLRWEPRFLPTKIELLTGDAQSGLFELSLEGIATTGIDDIAAGTSVQLAIPLGGFA